MKKLLNRYINWTTTWTRSQCVFLFCLNLWWLAVACYAAYRFEVARETAIYWQERALNHNVHK